ncbi:MAG: ribbon-helix-helix domain-containing protein [Clostridia bacterium]
MKLKSFLLDEEIHKKIKILAINENKSIKELIHEALFDLLQKYLRKQQ